MSKDEMKNNIEKEEEKKTDLSDVVSDGELSLDSEKASENIEKTDAEGPEKKDENIKKDSASEPKTDNVDSPKSSDKKDQRGQRGKRGQKAGFQSDKEDDGFIERVIKISRVSKVVKGGKNFSFNAMVVVGDTNGNVGMGFGKSNEVVEAIKKGTVDARKNLLPIALTGDTIPYKVTGEFKATRVLLMPAGQGTGVIAGGPVRALCDAVGIKNILTKSLGSRNPINVVRATINGFKQLRLKRIGQ